MFRGWDEHGTSTRKGGRYLYEGAGRGVGGMEEGRKGWVLEALTAQQTQGSVDMEAMAEFRAEESPADELEPKSQASLVFYEPCFLF